MAHYAKVVGGVVVEVMRADPEFFDTFIDQTPGTWLQTSYNTRGGVHYDPETGEPSADQSKAFRKNFAGIGFSYDRKLDAFIPPKPLPSAVFDEETCTWDFPVPYPDDGKNYRWNEEAQTWDEVAV